MASSSSSPLPTVFDLINMSAADMLRLSQSEKLSKIYENIFQAANDGAVRTPIATSRLTPDVKNHLEGKGFELTPFSVTPPSAPLTFISWSKPVNPPKVDPPPPLPSTSSPKIHLDLSQASFEQFQANFRIKTSELTSEKRAQLIARGYFIADYANGYSYVAWNLIDNAPLSSNPIETKTPPPTQPKTPPPTQPKSSPPAQPKVASIVGKPMKGSTNCSDCLNRILDEIFTNPSNKFFEFDAADIDKFGAELVKNLKDMGYPSKFDGTALCLL